MGGNDRASCVNCQKNVSPHYEKFHLQPLSVNCLETVKVDELVLYVRQLKCLAQSHHVRTPGCCLEVPD